jgi:hypothetical protein
MLLVRYGAEDAIDVRERVGPGWRFVALCKCTSEEGVVEIGVVYVEFVWGDADYWTFWLRKPGFSDGVRK